MSTVDKIKQTIRQTATNSGWKFTDEPEREGWYVQRDSVYEFLTITEMVSQLDVPCKPGLLRRLLKTTLGELEADSQFRVAFTPRLGVVNTNRGVLDLNSGELHPAASDQVFTYAVDLPVASEAIEANNGHAALKHCLQTPAAVAFTGRHARQWIYAVLKDLHPVVCGSEHVEIRTAFHGLAQQIDDLRAVAFAEASGEAVVRLIDQWRHAPCYSLIVRVDAETMDLPTSSEDVLLVDVEHTPVSSSLLQCIAFASAEVQASTPSPLLFADRVKAFVDARCEVHQDRAARARGLYSHYLDFCEADSVYAVSNQQFYARLVAMGFGYEDSVISGLWCPSEEGAD